MSNLKQFGLAFTQYAQDYDERFPTSADLLNIPNITWDTTIEPYLKNKQILVCRSDGIIRKTGGCSPTGLSRSYSIPEATSTMGTVSLFITGQRVPATGSSAYLGRNLSEIGQAAGTILLAEHPSAFNRAGSNGEVFLRTPDEQTGQGCPDGDIEPLHFGAWNYLFADSHVKWLKPEATINGPGKTAGSMANPKGMWTVDPND